jgi:outer membrane protein TolC
MKALLFSLLFFLTALPAYGKAYTVQSLLDASARSPGVQKMEALASAAKASAGMEGSLMDAMATVGAIDLGLPALMDADTFKFSVMLSQTFPVAGQNVLRGNAAEATARSQALNAALEKAMSRRRVLSSLAGIEALLEKRAIAEEELTVVERMLGTMRSRYTSGGESLPAVIAAEGEVSRMSNILLMSDSDRAMLLSDLATSVGVSATDLEAPRFPLWKSNASSLPDSGGLVSAAMYTYPALAARGTDIDRAGIRRTLAALAWVPDLTVGVEYDYMPRPMPEHMASVQLGVSLPIFSGVAKLSGMAMAEADGKAAKASLDELSAAVSNRVFRLSAEASSLDAQVHNLEASGIALSEQNLRSLLTAIEVGNADAEMLFRSVVKLYELKTARIEYRLRLLDDLFELEVYTGKSLVQIPSETEEFK